MGENSYSSEPTPETEFRRFIPEKLHDTLNTGKQLVGAMGSAYEIYAQKLNELEQRLSEGRFHLAVLGQVKRGKSTLINALLGEEVLPSSVIPLTAIPTFIQYGEQRGLKIKYLDDRADVILNSESRHLTKDKDSPGSPEDLSEIEWLKKQLIDFVTEGNNPNNEKEVLQVEVTHPAPILRDVVIIDTPGIGSTYLHNTEVTINFLPQCDAALFVVSADPPITEVELTFLKDIKNKISKLFFVLNKVDYLNEAELANAFDFYKKVLIKEVGIDPNTPIFPISARKALQAKESNDIQKWNESNLSKVSDYLTNFLAHEKDIVLKDAIGRKALDIFNQTYLQIELEIRSLELPLTELESRLSLFEKKIVEAEQQRIHTQDILNGDRKRVRDLLEEHIRGLQTPLCSRLVEISEKVMLESPDDTENAAQKAVADAIPELFKHELDSISEIMDKEIAVRMKDQEQRIDNLVESIRKTASEVFEIPYHAYIGGHVYDDRRKPYFVQYDQEDLFIQISPNFIERLMPAKMREKRVKERMNKQIDKLVLRNLENIRWETLQNIDTTFRKFSSSLDNNLSMTIKATHGTIRSSVAERKMHEENAVDKIVKLKNMALDIQNVIRLLGYRENSSAEKRW
ncbi:MAG: dynamin family protein [Methanomethylovorans sp.]|uniref:dynamin family protein n=1 Tax=Methanomethylovorans sp. TaxID=2758717 RepID=UPI003530FFF2